MTNMPDSPKPRSTRRWLALVAKFLLTAAILYFVYDQISSHWDQIKDYQWRVDILKLVLSVVLGVITLVVMAGVWKLIIAGFGHQLSLGKSFRVFYLSNLGRYVPGKVWQLLGILYLAKKEGIEPETAGASFLVVQLFAIPASFLVFALAAQFEPDLIIERFAVLGSYSGWLMAVGMLAFCGTLVMFPSVVLKLANRLLRLIGRPQVEFRLDKSVALTVLLGYCLGWIMYGMAFWLFVSSVAPQTELGPIAAIGLFNAAYQIGYLALFAPGGFGPRELVMGLMLTPFVGAIGPAVAVLARLWAIFVEGIAALMALAVRK